MIKVALTPDCVSCPYCGADIAQPCRAKSGKRFRENSGRREQETFHMKRIRAAEAESRRLEKNDAT